MIIFEGFWNRYDWIIFCEHRRVYLDDSVSGSGNEATVGLSLAREHQLTVLTVGHHPATRKFHSPAQKRFSPFQKLYMLHNRKTEKCTLIMLLVADFVPYCLVLFDGGDKLFASFNSTGDQLVNFQNSCLLPLMNNG
jgi:hypothetical protein